MLYKREREEKEALRKKLNAVVVAASREFEAAIEGIGLRAGRTVLGASSTRIEVTSNRPELTEKLFSYTLRVEVDSGMWRASGTPKLSISLTKNTSLRHEAKRWSRPDNALKAVVAILKQAEIDAVGVQQGAVAASLDRQQKDAKRAQELKGVVVPPGTEINVVYGNSHSAGMYRVEFERYGSKNGYLALPNLDLTADQVRRLVALLNEFVPSKLYIIRAVYARPGVDEQPLTCYWTNQGWMFGWSPDRNPFVFPEAQVQEQLEKARGALPAVVDAKPELVPYTEYATI